jgi:hypothetical protein
MMKKRKNKKKAQPVEVQGDMCQISTPHAFLVIMHST